MSKAKVLEKSPNARAVKTADGYWVIMDGGVSLSALQDTPAKAWAEALAFEADASLVKAKANGNHPVRVEGENQAHKVHVLKSPGLTSV